MNLMRRATSRSVPERSRRENWWLFARPNTELRGALSGLPRYIATGQVAKHRFFQWLDRSILPDDKLIAIAINDALHLGVLSSAVHVRWALATGGFLGVGNDPVYVKTKCFEAFPFPSAETGLTPNLVAQIRTLAEQIDTHRKSRQAAHADVTLTGLYNVLEKLRSGEALNAKEKEKNGGGMHLPSTTASGSGSAAHGGASSSPLGVGGSGINPPLAAAAGEAPKE